MRHDAFQHDLKALGNLGGITVIDQGLGQLLERDGRKGDLLFKGMGKNNKDLMTDITFGCAIAPSYLHNSAHIPKYVLNLLANNKIEKYRDGYRAVGIDFEPVALEMHGQTSDFFLTLLKKLAKAAADVNNMHYSLVFNYWKIRLSSTLQRYNGKILIMAKNKINRMNNFARDGDVDVTDMIANERHVHNNCVF